MTERSSLFILPLLIVAVACSDDDTGQGADAGAVADQAVKNEAGADLAAPDMSAPYTLTPMKRVRINSTGSVNVRKATADLAFDKGPYAKVVMSVELESSCYPFTKWQSNPPPAGHNWPKDCDAYDRNFSFYLDPPKATGDPPALELQRAITPFGGPMTYDLDITDIANGLPGKHTLKVTISTWSDSKGKVSGAAGGWWVTAKFAFTPGTAPRKVLAVTPLVAHSYKDNAGKKVQADLTVPAGVKTAKVEYRVTGHGGGTADSACIGHADEFCQRQHHVYVDSKELTDTKDKILAPWRTDCAKGCTLATASFGQYCKENPCGSISSVKASRANWCPGAVTPPIIFKPADLLTAGKHTWGYAIDKVAKGGSWVVSATYFAYGN